MTTVSVEGIATKRSVGLNADTMLGVLLVLPILVTMAALVFYPMVRTVWDSLHRVN
ncbi:carbohydrate ABC transporter permease, partial [Bradyrhizobium sp. Lot11]